MVMSFANEYSDASKEKKQKEQIMLYYSKGSYTSEKVLVYLYERCIDFTSFNVDLSKGEELTCKQIIVFLCLIKRACPITFSTPVENFYTVYSNEM